jgi:hypothetical protein
MGIAPADPRDLRSVRHAQVFGARPRDGARDKEKFVKWMGLYLLGYALLIGAALLTLWKTGVLASIPPFWLGVGLLAAMGLGIMVAVANSGKKETIDVNRG